jgi:hypothetical protein
MANLRQENAWLRDPVSREKALRIAAASSSAVEGIRKPYSATTKAATSRKLQKSAGLRP